MSVQNIDKNTSNIFDKDSIIDRVHKLSAEMNNKQIDRQELVQILIVSLFSLHHTFLLGEPGVSKTGILEIFANAIDDDNAFNITIKDDTKYEEIFGDRYRDDNGKLIYDSEGSIVASSFAILDEVWKGNSKILNSLLSIMSGYRTIDIMGKGKIKAPLLMVGGASNELPIDKAVRPLRDRFLFSYVVQKITGKEDWIRFASRGYDRNPNIENKFNREEIVYIFEEAKTVEVPEYFYDALFRVRQRVVALNMNVSDRKFDGAADVFRVSATLNRRNTVDMSDIFFLMHILWDKEPDIDLINKILNDEIFGQLDAIVSYVNQIDEAAKRIDSKINGELSSLLRFRKAYPHEEEELFAFDCQNIVLVFEELSGLKDASQQLVSHYNMNVSVEKQLEENAFIKSFKSPIYSVFDVNIIFNLESLIQNRMEYLAEWHQKYSKIHKYNHQVSLLSAA